MSINKLSGIIGNVFTLGKTSNQVAIRNNSGVIQAQNFGGSWQNILGQSVPTSGNLTESTSSILTITGGNGAVLGSGTSIEVKQASGSQAGYLSSSDWTTFNSKQASLGYTPLNPTNNLSDVSNTTTARNNILPSQSSNGGKFLTTDGTNASWASPSITYTVTSPNTNYNVLTTDQVLLCTSGVGGITLTLPTATSMNGKMLMIKKVDSGAGSLVIDGNGSETIDGAVTVTVSSQYSYVNIVSNGTAWFIVGGTLWN